MIGTTLGHYRVVEKIGAGGMGVVYRAHDERLDRDVAIKVLHEAVAQDADRLARFEREAKAVAKLDHPNILAIHDFGLAKLKLPKQDLTTETPTATLDTAPGGPLGTVAYMAPEQVRGLPADHRSDIFALGVVLYEMLTGHRPFGGGTTVETAAAILKEDPEPISAVSPGVQPALATVVSKCLEKRPEDRFSSTHDLSLTLGVMESATATPPRHEKSMIGRRWPHILAIVIAAVVALLFILPPTALIERLTGTVETAPIRSIAVLPLDNLSGDPEQEYFANGMTEALISKLAQIGSLDIISRTSIMLYKDSKKPLPQIVRELGVDAIIEGSVTRDKNNVRITVQLIHGATDRHLWAEDYQRPLRDVLLLQGEVARAVAQEIDAALTDEENRRLVHARTVDPEAHEAYLKGMHHFLLFTGDGLTRGAEYLRRAIELDPGYADAYAALAAVHLNSIYFLSLPPTEVVPQARNLLTKALELDPNNAGAVLSEAWIQMTYDWDWDAAERSHLRALELGPSLSHVHGNFAYLLACRGDVEEAVIEARRAEQLDPVSPTAGQHVGMMLYLARRYDESVAQFENTIELSPYYWFTYQRLAQVLITTGEYDRGIELTRNGIELAGPDTLRTGKHTLAYLYAQSGNRAQAVKILREFEEEEKSTYVPPCDLAQIHTALGNVDEAFRWLDKAVEVRDADLFMTKIWPVWDPLRHDPRFDELLRRLNLFDD